MKYSKDPDYSFGFAFRIQNYAFSITEFLTNEKSVKQR